MKQYAPLTTNPAEEAMCDHAASLLARSSAPAEILNIGADVSETVEQRILAQGVDITADRIDVADPTIDRDYVRHCWIGSIEDMAPVPSGTYDLTFANFVLEHVNDVHQAAAEVFRVLKPGGYFLFTVPNPQAPEFRVSSKTPLWFHEAMRGKQAWPTVYAFRSVEHLANIFHDTGFEIEEINRYASFAQYVRQPRLLAQAAMAYDGLVEKRDFNRAKGLAFVVARKP